MRTDLLDYIFGYEPTWKWKSQNNILIKNDGICDIIIIHVPGYSKEDVKIEVEDNVLSVKGDLSSIEEVEKLDNKFTLQKEYDLSKTEAEVKNGILKIKLFEKNKELNTYQIKLK